MEGTTEELKGQGNKTNEAVDTYMYLQPLSVYRTILFLQFLRSRWFNEDSATTRNFSVSLRKKAAGIAALCRDFLTTSDEKIAVVACVANKSTVPFNTKQFLKESPKADAAAHALTGQRLCQKLPQSHPNKPFRPLRIPLAFHNRRIDSSFAASQ